MLGTIVYHLNKYEKGFWKQVAKVQRNALLPRRPTVGSAFLRRSTLRTPQTCFRITNLLKPPVKAMASVDKRAIMCGLRDSQEVVLL